MLSGGRVMGRYEKQSPLDWHTVSSRSPIGQKNETKKISALFPYHYTLVLDKVHVYMSELTSDSLV